MNGQKPSINKQANIPAPVNAANIKRSDRRNSQKALIRGVGIDRTTELVVSSAEVAFVADTRVAVAALVAGDTASMTREEAAAARPSDNTRNEPTMKATARRIRTLRRCRPTSLSSCGDAF